MFKVGDHIIHKDSILSEFKGIIIKIGAEYSVERHDGVLYNHSQQFIDRYYIISALKWIPSLLSYIFFKCFTKYIFIPRYILYAQDRKI